MKKPRQTRMWWSVGVALVVVAVLVGLFGVLGTAGCTKASVGTVSNITCNVEEGAALDTLNVYMKKKSGFNTVWVDFTVKNLSDATKSYEVWVMADDVPAVWAEIRDVEPGETGKPIKSGGVRTTLEDSFPQKLDIIVKSP